MTFMLVKESLEYISMLFVLSDTEISVLLSVLFELSPYLFLQHFAS